MRNPWIQRNKIRTGPRITFMFEVMGYLPVCDVEVIDPPTIHPKTGMCLKSGNPMFMAFVNLVNAGGFPSKLVFSVGYLSVLDRGNNVECWGMHDIHPTHTGGYVAGPTPSLFTQVAAHMWFTCANAAQINSNYFVMK